MLSDAPSIYPLTSDGIYFCNDAEMHEKIKNFFNYRYRTLNLSCQCKQNQYHRTLQGQCSSYSWRYILYFMCIIVATCTDRSRKIASAKEALGRNSCPDIQVPHDDQDYRRIFSAKSLSGGNSSCSVERSAREWEREEENSLKVRWAYRAAIDLSRTKDTYVVTVLCPSPITLWSQTGRRHDTTLLFSLMDHAKNRTPNRRRGLGDLKYIYRAIGARVSARPFDKLDY